MATAYSADTYGDQQVNIAWYSGSAFIRPFSFNIATNTSNTGFVVNDTVKLCPILSSGKDNLLVIGYQVEIPSLDTGTSVTLDLGDTNGASNAFQATFVSNQALGQNAASVMNPLMSFNGTTAAAPVRGVVPKQYTAAGVYTAQSNAFKTIDFVLKVHTAPNTATTTGTIKGYLMLCQLPSSSVTF